MLRLPQRAPPVLPPLSEGGSCVRPAGRSPCQSCTRPGAAPRAAGRSAPRRPRRLAQRGLPTDRAASSSAPPAIECTGPRIPASWPATASSPACTATVSKTPMAPRGPDRRAPGRRVPAALAARLARRRDPKIATCRTHVECSSSTRAHELGFGTDPAGPAIPVAAAGEDHGGVRACGASTPWHGGALQRLLRRCHASLAKGLTQRRLPDGARPFRFSTPRGAAQAKGGSGAHLPRPARTAGACCEAGASGSCASPATDKRRSSRARTQHLPVGGPCREVPPGARIGSR